MFLRFCDSAPQIQLERLLARQMEILQDAAVQERLQALDWRIPPAALKYLNDAQNTNGTVADASRDNHGTSSLERSKLISFFCLFILLCVLKNDEVSLGEKCLQQVV